jgi:hypothetical protein
MFEVYNTRTSQIMARRRDIVRANQIAIGYNSAYAWINNDKFDYRVADASNNRSNKPVQTATRVRKASREESDRISLLRHIS